MLTGQIRNDIDKLWEKFWTGGIANPLTVIEQISYLMFARMLDMQEEVAERKAAARQKQGKGHKDFPSLFPKRTERRTERGRIYLWHKVRPLRMPPWTLSG